MAGPLFKLWGSLGLDARQFDQGLSQREKMLRGFGGGIAAGLGLGAGLGAFQLAQRGVGMVVDGIGDAIDAASDWEEANSKVGVVFESMAGDVRDFASTSAESMGMAENAALDALGTFGNFTQALGLSESASADMSKAMVQLAADIGSFNNVASDEVLLALRSGLSGEAEPMRRFGVALSEAAVSERLLAQGIEKTNGRFTEAQKVQARYELIMAQTTKAQGDFARTSDGLANSQRILDARLANLQTSLGRGLLPIAKEVVGVFGGFADVIEGLTTAGPGSLSDAIRSLDLTADALAGVKLSADQLAARGDLYGTVFDDFLDGAHQVRDAMADVGLLPGLVKEGEWRAALSPIAHTLGYSDDAIKAFITDATAMGMTLDEARGKLERLFESRTEAMREAERGRTLAEIFDPRTSVPTPVFTGFSDLARTAMSAVTDASRELKAPFATFHKEAPEEVEQTFAEIRAEIRQGFGSVKQALQGGSKIIDPETRMKNMRSRLGAASKNLKRAVEVGDPFAISYWRGAVQKQRLNLDDYEQKTSRAFADVKRDSTRKARETTDGVIEQARRMVREIRQMSLYDAGLKLMRSWQAGIRDGSVGFFPGGVPSAPAPRSAFTAVTAGGGGGVHITVNGLYGGDPGLRELERVVRRAVRLSDRDRG